MKINQQKIVFIFISMSDSSNTIENKQSNEIK
jgi:hypothetical protein